MCSIGEDDFGDEGGQHSMPVTENIVPDIAGSVCKKCNSPAVVKLNFKEPQCRDCFLYHVRHKFRANLGSTKILPKNCSVLSVFDGSAESVCLLDLVFHALHEENHKKLRFDHSVLFIDDMFLLQEQEKKLKEKIVEIFKQFPDGKLLFVSLAEDGKKPAVDFPPDWLNGNPKEEIFKELRTSFTSQTAWEDFMVQRRKNIIRNVAFSCNFTHVFLPDITTDLATSLLSNVLLGRGASVALDVGFVDDRLNDVKLLRPIRDLTHQEVTNFVRVRELLFLDASTTVKDPTKSIQGLTEKFVQDLQSNFSSTVATVFRTGDKLAPRNLDTAPCAFCQSAIDGAGSKTLSAVEFSRTVSSGQSSDLPPRNQESSQYCYSCRKILSECPGIEEFLVK